MAIENEIVVYRFEDKTFKLKIRDAVGALIDFSTGYDNIVIIIYNADRTVLQQYSRTTTVGWKAIDVTNQASGEFSVVLESADTESATLQKKYIEVLVRKTSGLVAGGKYDTISSKYLFTLKDSISSAVTLP
jgi:hypothetical protein